MQKLVTLQFCDFLRNLAVGSKWQKKKETTIKMNQGKLRMKYPTSVNPNTGKQSCLLVHFFHFNLAELIFLKLPYDRRGVKIHF